MQVPTTRTALIHKPLQSFALTFSFEHWYLPGSHVLYAHVLMQYAINITAVN